MVVMGVVEHALAGNASQACPRLEGRAVAMLPHAGASLVEPAFQALRRLQDGGFRAPITAPARPDRRSSSIAQLLFNLHPGRPDGRGASNPLTWRPSAVTPGIAGLLTYALIYLASAQALRGEFLDAMASAEKGCAHRDPTSGRPALDRPADLPPRRCWPPSPVTRRRAWPLFP